MEERRVPKGKKDFQIEEFCLVDVLVGIASSSILSFVPSSMALPGLYEEEGTESFLMSERGTTVADDSDADEDSAATETAPMTAHQLANRIRQFYAKLKARHPLLAKSLLGALTSGLGSMIGLAILRSPPEPAGPKSRRARGGTSSGIDFWLEVASFTIYGGLIGGPIGHYWDRWMRDHGPELRTNAMLFDQIVAQPPRLLFMALVLDMAKASLREIPSALSRGWTQFTPGALAESWFFWPLVTYVSSRVLRKRKHYETVMKICALFWASQLARRRARDRSAT